MPRIITAKPNQKASASTLLLVVQYIFKRKFVIFIMKMFWHIQVVFLWRLLAFLCTFGEMESKPSSTTRTHFHGLQLFDANEGISNQIDRSSLLRRNGDQVSKNRYSKQWKRDEETINKS